ncbi:MAG: efflux RND transporter periplasmic adaptor subunit [Kiritimatiellae bacterium]|nr:efflux RND transporter periplasmic adaptor subunit [Kiritimatiellia bacterium]
MASLARAIVLSALTAGAACAQTPAVSGITEPVHDSTLSPTVAGALAVIHKKEGDFVRKGDVILELDSRIEELEVERRKLVAESKAEVVAASNRVETLRLDTEATIKLFEATQSVSREELEKKKLELKLAEGELARLEIAEERELIEYQMALAQLENRRLSAPFDGVITKVHLEVGEYCNPQQPLARVVDTRQCYFVTHVEAAGPWRLTAGAKVTLRFSDGRRTITRPGEVAYVSPVIDPSSGLQEFKVLFDNADGEIQPGITGVMTLADEHGSR